MDNKLKHIKQTGFKVPEHYFQSFENDILNKISSIPKDNGFVVDHGYFNTLETKVMQSIQEKPKVISFSPWKRLAYTSMIAASLIIAVNVLFTNKHLDFDDIETASLENYIETGIEFNELSSFLDEETIYLNDFTKVDLSESMLENYLLNDFDSKIEDLIIE